MPCLKVTISRVEFIRFRQSNSRNERFFTCLAVILVTITSTNLQTSRSFSPKTFYSKLFHLLVLLVYQVSMKSQRLYLSFIEVLKASTICGDTIVFNHQTNPSQLKPAQMDLIDVIARAKKGEPTRMGTELVQVSKPATFYKTQNITCNH